MGQIELRPATAGDADAIARIHYYALEEFQEIYIAFWVNHPRDILPESTRKALQDPSQTFLVAADAASGEVLGFVRYYIAEEAGGEVKDVQAVGNSDEQGAQSLKALFAPKKHLKELWERFNERDDEMDACQENTLKGCRHICMCFHASVYAWFTLTTFTDIKHLMTDPKHQRRGIGKKLLGSVVAESDAAGVPAFIVSSIAARALYTNLGFEGLETFPIDNAYWASEIAKHEQELGLTGNEGLIQKCEGLEEADTCMVRWPR
jgi:ribosomal protein S18 acetylase RimI-like enzyme